MRIIKSHAHPRSRLALLVVACLAVAGAVGAQSADAFPGYAHGTASACATCHAGETSPVTTETCTAAGCHVGFKVPAGQTDCWTCHDPGQSMSAVGPGAPDTCTAACHRASYTEATVAGTPHDPHSERGACTQSGCHAVSTTVSANGSAHHTLATPVATTVRVKVSSATIRLRRTVKVAGSVTPTDMGGSVTLTVQMRKKAKFVTVKAVTRSVSASGAYSYTYKPAKRGAYQVRAVIKASDSFAGSKSRIVKFTVK